MFKYFLLYKKINFLIQVLFCPPAIKISAQFFPFSVAAIKTTNIFKNITSLKINTISRYFPNYFYTLFKMFTKNVIIFYASVFHSLFLNSC